MTAMARFSLSFKSVGRYFSKRVVAYCICCFRVSKQILSLHVWNVFKRVCFSSSLSTLNCCKTFSEAVGIMLLVSVIFPFTGCFLGTVILL